jgi:hypothetical protein
MRRFDEIDRDIDNATRLAQALHVQLPIAPNEKAKKTKVQRG